MVLSSDGDCSGRYAAFSDNVVNDCFRLEIGQEFVRRRWQDSAAEMTVIDCTVSRSIQVHATGSDQVRLSLRIQRRRSLTTRVFRVPNSILLTNAANQWRGQRN